LSIGSVNSQTIGTRDASLQISVFDTERKQTGACLGCPRGRILFYLKTVDEREGFQTTARQFDSTTFHAVRNAFSITVLANKLAASTAETV
jgi:hypothetical protein